MARKTTAKCLFALSTVAAIGIGMLLPSGSANAWSIASASATISEGSTVVLTVYTKQDFGKKNLPTCMSEHPNFVQVVSKDKKYSKIETGTNANGDSFKWSCKVKGLTQTDSSKYSALNGENYVNVAISKPEIAEKEAAKTVKVTVTPSVTSEIAAKADEIAAAAGSDGISPKEMKDKLKEAGYTKKQWNTNLNKKQAWLGTNIDWNKQILKVGRRIYFEHTGAGSMTYPKAIQTELKSKHGFKDGKNEDTKYLKYFIANFDSAFEGLGAEIYGKTYKDNEYLTYAAIRYIEANYTKGLKFINKKDSAIKKQLVKKLGFSEATADRAIKDRNAHIPTVDGIKDIVRNILISQYGMNDATADAWVKKHIKK